LMMKLVSGDFFSNYVNIDEPFELGTIEPHKELTSIIPERVKINVSADLNLQLPAAKGELTFKRKDFTDAVTKSVEPFTTKKKR
jgi:hypothetical protein